MNPTIQAPGFQGTTQETSRVLKRGQLEYFIFEFFYDEASTQPVQPIDPQTYPNFRIFSPTGELLQQGLAVPATAPGIWKIGWVVPLDAQLTNVNMRYRMQAIMVDANFRQFETTYDFDVVDTAVPAQHPELQQSLTFVNSGMRLYFNNTVRPDYLTAKVVPRNADNSPLFFANFTYPLPANPGPNTIYERVNGDHYTYYIDVPNFPTQGDYTVVWTVRDGPDSPQDMEFQAIQVIGSSTIHMIKSVRMLIDKLQKKLGLVYAYTNEDFVEYLKQGISRLNTYTPPTTYSLTNLPSPLESLAILAAAAWGLSAQRLLYAETNMEFSGQTVTLGYNPGADLDSMIDRWNGMVNDQAAKTKNGIVRAGSAAGYIATRPQRFRSGLVFKTGSVWGNSQNENIFNVLNAYGIPIDS